MRLAAPWLIAAASSKNVLPPATRNSVKYRSGLERRLSRIRRRAIPEVKAAYEQGAITVRRADRLLYLAPAQQLSELNQILSAREEAGRRSRVAAGILQGYIRRGCRDLVALRQELESALATVR
jgi:hypothetical protein